MHDTFPCNTLPYATCCNLFGAQLEVGSASSSACVPHKTSTILHDDLCKNVVALKLLQFLGFTFQPPEGVSISHPYVLVPCSDDRGLLFVCLEALRSLNGMI